MTITHEVISQKAYMNSQVYTFKVLVDGVPIPDEENPESDKHFELQVQNGTNVESSFNWFLNALGASL